VKVKSGGNCHIALTYDGHIYAWGLSRYGVNMNIRPISDSSGGNTDIHNHSSSSSSSNE